MRRSTRGTQTSRVRGTDGRRRRARNQSVKARPSPSDATSTQAAERSRLTDRWCIVVRAQPDNSLDFYVSKSTFAQLLLAGRLSDVQKYEDIEGLTDAWWDGPLTETEEEGL